MASDKTKISQVLDQLTKDSELILGTKFCEKIAELHEICNQDIWKIERISEIRKESEQLLENYFEELEALQDGEEPQQNPLMQLLMGGKGEDDKEAKESKSLQKVSSSTASKLLLNSIKLSEDNKINLKLCLELEKKESKPKLDQEALENAEEVQIEELTEEPPAKKSKSSKNEVGDASEDKEKTDDSEESEKLDEEKEQEKKKDPVISIHKSIVELIKIIKPQIDVLTDWCVTLRAWLLLSIQRNKNLGGADLQGECQAVIIEEIKGVEDEFSAYKELLTSYHLTKATILEKYIKTPEYEDLKSFIIDEDEKIFVSCRNIIFALRNQTMSLYDAIDKDSERLFGDNHDSASMGFNMY